MKTDGELWAEALLVDLRAARFTPAAWARFFAQSFARARRRRRERRREHRTVLVLAGGGIACWSAFAFVRPGLAVGGAAWWLLVVLMLDWHLGMLERPNGRPVDGLGVANVLSVVRAGTVPLFAALPLVPVGVLLLGAGATDVADGYLARRRDEITRLGVWLDAAVDGVVLSVAAVAVARHDRLSPWLAVLVVARYLLPWLVVGLAYFVSATPPSRHGYVSGRVPGVVLLIGLSAAAFALPGAQLLVVAGVLGGFATFAATVTRSLGSRG